MRGWFSVVSVLKQHELKAYGGQRCGSIRLQLRHQVEVIRPDALAALSWKIAHDIWCTGVRMHLIPGLKFVWRIRRVWKGRVVILLFVTHYDSVLLKGGVQMVTVVSSEVLSQDKLWRWPRTPNPPPPNYRYCVMFQIRSTNNYLTDEMSTTLLVWKEWDFLYLFKQQSL